MKNTLKLFLLLPIIFASCKNKNEKLVEEKFIDSLLNINTLSENEERLKQDLLFWKKRFELDRSSYTNSQKYAGMLSSYFHQYGNINDLKIGEKLTLKNYAFTKGNEASLCRNLSNFASVQHNFIGANLYASKALIIGENRYESLLLLFDAAFELGKISEAKTLLQKIKKPYEYAYFFRLAKMQHYDGDLAKSIESMNVAASLANGNIFLQQAAISNMADLQLHAGEYEEAAINFKKSIAIDKADFHSLKGLAVIAQNHDKNFALADKIFKYLALKTKNPDILFNLTLLAQSSGNKILERKYAEDFAKIASLPAYGNMYNKYLFELYDGILKNPKKMLEIAQREILNRDTPQTNSWYAWALYRNNKKAEAMAIYKNKIAEKPLEGLELFLIGKMMKIEAENYNANAFFTAAYKNRFELSPANKIELELLMKS